MASFPHLKDSGPFPGLNINNYKMNSGFDYSQYDTPQMIITCCNVPWDLGTVHVGQKMIGGIGNVVYFKNEEERDAWFDNIPDNEKFVWTTKFRAWHDGAKVKIPLPFDQATAYNYLYVQYMDLPVELESETKGWKKWFLFMREIEADSPNSSTCVCMHDIWQQIVYSLKIPYMILNRGHAPMADIALEDYLANPIDNSKMLVTPDINFGECNRITSSKRINIDTSNQIAVFNCTSNIFDFKNIDNNEVTTPAIVYNPVSSVPDNRYVFAVNISDLDGFLNKIISSIPHFMQCVSAFYLLPINLISTSSAGTWNGYTLYEITCKTFTSEGSYTFNKKDFNFEEQYADLVKLYTYPYSKLVISTESGSRTELKIQDCAGTLDFKVAVNNVVDALNFVGHIDGVNGNLELTTSFNLLDEKNFTTDGAWFKTCMEWNIPTYQVQISGYDEDRYSTKFKRAQMKTAAENAYKAQADNRQIQYEIDVNNADCGKTIRDNDAETAYTTATNSASTNKTTADRTATANKNIADNTASSNKTQSDRSTTAKYNANTNTTYANYLVAQNNLDCFVDNTVLDMSFNTAQTAMNNSATAEILNYKNNQIDDEKGYTQNLASGTLSAQDDYNIATTGIANTQTSNAAQISLNAQDIQAGVWEYGIQALGDIFGFGSSLASNMYSTRATAQNTIDAANASLSAIIGLNTSQTSLTNIYNSAMGSSQASYNSACTQVDMALLAEGTELKNELVADQADNTSECMDDNADIIEGAGYYAASQYYNAGLNNASTEYTTATGNASTEYSAKTSNNTDIYNVAVKNAKLVEDNSLDNSETQYDTDMENAELRAKKALNSYTADYNTALSAIDNLSKQNALREPFRFGLIQNNGYDTQKPLGVSFNIIRQSDSQIELVGNEWLKYGYYYKSYYPFDGNFNKMPKFTYWKCSDISMEAPGIPDAYVDQLRLYLIDGVTVWAKPEYIGTTTIFENKEA